MFILALAGIAVNLLNLFVLDSHIGHGHSHDHDDDGHAHGHEHENSHGHGHAHAGHDHSSGSGAPMNGAHQHIEAAAVESGAVGSQGSHCHHHEGASCGDYGGGPSALPLYHICTLPTMRPVRRVIALTLLMVA